MDTPSERAPGPVARGVRALVCCAVLAGAFLLAGRAETGHADADPASDVLLAQSAFYPYQPAVAPSLEATLNGLLQSAERAGLPLKVAVIGSREDLGAVPEFFGHPQSYARFLDKEISFNNNPPLLVVMPAGFGVIEAESSALAGAKIDTRHGTDGLVRTAIEAVTLLVRSAGKTIKEPSIPSASSRGGGPPSFVLFAVPLGFAALFGVVAIRRGRPRRRKRPGRARDQD